MIADAEAFGFSAEAIAELRAEAEQSDADEGLSIHPDNEVAVRMLLALQTQWQWVGLSTMQRAELRRTGLNYLAIKPTAKLSGVKVRPDDFTRLRILEAECLNAWAEEAKRR